MGTLYLSFTFYEMNTKEMGQYPRTLVMSEDNGKSWRLATTAAMQSLVIEKNKSIKPN